MEAKENPLFRLTAKFLFTGKRPTKFLELNLRQAARLREHMRATYDRIQIDYQGKRVKGKVLSRTTGWKRVSDDNLRDVDLVISDVTGSLIGHLTIRRLKLSRLGKRVYPSRGKAPRRR